MKSKVLNTAIIFACLFSLFMISIRFNKLNIECSQIEQISDLKTDSIRKITRFIENTNLLTNTKVENCCLTNIYTSEPLKLSSLLNETLGTKIICRLIDTSCGSCNKKQIEMINGLRVLENLIILSYARNARQLRFFTYETNSKSTIYQINSSQKLFPDDDNTKVLVMYVNNEGAILRAYHLNEDIFFMTKHILPI